MVSDVKSEMDDVAFLYAVVLAFEAPFARFFCASFAMVTDKVVVGDDFGADEAAFEIGVDDTGSLRRGGVFRHGPGAYFFDAGGEVGAEAEQLVTGTDDAV